MNNIYPDYEIEVKDNHTLTVDYFIPIPRLGNNIYCRRILTYTSNFPKMTDADKTSFIKSIELDAQDHIKYLVALTPEPYTSE